MSVDLTTLALVPCAPAGRAAWSQRTALDGVDFLLSFEWSQRDGHWSLSIADVDEVPILSGRVLTTSGYPILGCTDTRRPVGELVMMDTTGLNDLDPGFADLGDRFRLVYLSAADLAAAE